jgi:hypothetical protein
LQTQRKKKGNTIAVVLGDGSDDGDETEEARVAGQKDSTTVTVGSHHSRHMDER